MKQKLTFLLTALLSLSGMSSWALEQQDGVYQIGTAQDLVDFAAIVNGGDNTVSGALTADIDMSTVANFTPIGTQTVNYAGTFDGKGHVISNLTSSGQYFIGLFGTATGGAVIKNVALKNANLKGARFVGIIGAGLGSGNVTLENVGFDGAAEATDKGVGGISGSLSGPVFSVKNCYVMGTIDGKAEAAGFVGYSSNGNNSFTNCWSSAFITGNEAGKTLYRGSVKLTNCYDVYGDQCTKVTGAQISSGELCYKLNGDQSEIAWYQTLEQDADPVLDAAHGKVYSTAPRRCDGQVIGEGTYTNDASQQSAIPAHQFENGVCTVCGQEDPDFMAPDAEGFYPISNANQLQWFASAVNKGETALKARLVADIDLSSVENFTPIGTQTVNFDGTFDGQGHAIKNLTSSGQFFIGLFGTVKGGAVIKNFVLKNADLMGQRFVGVVGAGLGSGDATIENVGFEGKAEATNKGAAGIVGSMSGPVFTVKNCYVTGTITAPSEAAGITSYSNNGNCTFINCWSSAEITGNESGKPFYRGAAKVTNCFNQYGLQANELTAEQLTSGEFTYTINKVAGESVFFQKLGEGGDAHPMLFGTDIVYSDGTTYTNTPSLPADEEGFCLIATAQDLVAFSYIVNNSNNAAKAKVTADIDMSSVENFTPIGTQTVNYVGTFDGQGHAIQNLTSSGQYFIGLFGTVAGGAVIKNFVLKNANLTGQRFVGVVGAGLGSGNATIENVGFEGKAEATNKGAAGIVGSMSGPVFTVKNCYVTGTITAPSEAAGITSYSNNGNCTFVNCWSSAEITGNESGKPFYRGAAKVTNCFNQYGLQASELTAEQLTSGELTYTINQGAGEFAFLQGEAYPTFQGNYVAKVADNGYGTFFVENADVEIPAEVEAYKGKIEGDVLEMTLLEGGVAAGTAMVLKGEPGYYCFAPSENPMMVEGNDLKGTTETTEANTLQYILAEVDGTVGFYQAVAGTYIPFAKAYLEIAADAGVKFIGFGDATGINEMTTDNRQQTTVIYDLQGRRVVKTTKGIYIVNGKKVLK